MKILLLNKNPIISKLVRLSAQKLEYEFDEQAHYADTLALADVIVVDDSVSANLKDLQNKCKKLICISSNATNTQTNPKILHKPFLPTDLIALMKDDEKPVANAETNAESKDEEVAQEKVADDTPLDLDSLSFDEPEPAAPSEQAQNEPDTNVYLQDIKEKDPTQESLDSNENLNLDDLNLEDSVETANSASETPAKTQESVETPATDLASDIAASALDDTNLSAENALGENDMNLGDLNLDFANTANESEPLPENADETPNLDESAENSAENVAQTPEEPKDEFSIEPIEFVETPLPTLESTATPDVEQSALETAVQENESTIQEMPSTQENIVQDTPSEEDEPKADDLDFQSVPNEELAFDNKDIADIMGLDEASVAQSENTDETQTESENAPSENIAQENVASEQDNVAQENEPSTEFESKDEVPSEQTPSSNDLPSENSAENALVDENLDESQENKTQSQDLPDDIDQSIEAENELAPDDENTQSAEISAENEQDLNNQNGEAEIPSENSAAMPSDEDTEAEFDDEKFSTRVNLDENLSSDESTQDLQDEPNAQESAQENEPSTELESKDETQSEQDEPSEEENPLDLDLANADFLQPLNEKPFSIEEKEEDKISFDDVPENAQFLGQKSEESVEPAEIRPVLVDEPRAQSTQDMVKEQLAALDAMDNADENNELLADLQGLSEEEVQKALGESAGESNTQATASEPSTDKNTQASAQSAVNSQASEVIDELSKGISGAITSSIKDDALKAALKGMNMHIDINIKFDEDKA